MRPYSLAFVLIKVLGVSCVVDGISRLSSVLAAVFIPIFFSANGYALKMEIVFKCLIQGMTLPEGAALLILGVFLLRKTDFIIKKILKIEDANPDA